MGRRIAVFVAVAVVAAIAALVALAFVSADGEVGPGRVEIRARLSSNGSTELGFPPLGRVSAHTHRAPVGIDANVNELDIERLQTLLNTDEPEAQLRSEVEHDITPLVFAFAWRALLVGLFAGALVGVIVPGRNPWFVGIGGLSGVLAVTALLGVTWRGFEPEAFDQPEFEGALQRAPEVIDAVQRHVDDIGTIRDRVDVIGLQLSRLYALAASPPEPTDDEDVVRILHVSDIHSNPLGIEIVADLAQRFDVAAVLDTGDLTSFGYPIESRLGELILSVRRPYLFVPGNHDSDQNRAGLANVVNVDLLDGEVVDVDGVRILGIADPTFTASNELDDEEAAEIKGEYADDVARLVERTRPDVLAVHDRRLAEQAYGSVPLVVSGHFHSRSISVEDETRVLTVGSTGATGLGSFTVEQDLGYEAEILNFVDGELRIVDYLTLSGLSGNYQIERRVVEQPDESEDDEAPTDDTEPDEPEPDEDDSAFRRHPAIAYLARNRWTTPGE